MPERIFKIDDLISSKGGTSMEVICKTKIHEIHLWRLHPGELIYQHIHSHNDDFWYIINGVGEYYLSANIKKVRPGDIALASPEEVHGIYNTGSEDIFIYSVLSPLPVEILKVPGFEYPE